MTETELSKAEWRRRLLAERERVPAAVHAAEAAAIGAALPTLLGQARVVCAYVPFGSEPGDIDLLEILRASAERVLLPVLPSRPAPLYWADFTGVDQLRPGRLPGLLEPTGPALPAATIGQAELILLPALAVDRRGVRLGRGAGYYDRSLPLAAATVRLVAIVRDGELVGQLPTDPHDQRIHAALTPKGGVARLPA